MLPNTVAEVALPDDRTFGVGSGTHRWITAAPATPSTSGAPSLDGPMTDVVDRPDASRFVRDGLAEWDADFAARFRRRVRCAPGRNLRDPLNKVPVAMMERIEERLRALG